MGASPREVMELLGHSGIALTMNTYSHLMEQAAQDAADRTDRFFGASEQES